jgi:hypothetical protein
LREKHGQGDDLHALCGIAPLCVDQVQQDQHGRVSKIAWISIKVKDCAGESASRIGGVHVKSSYRHHARRQQEQQGGNVN